MGALEELLSSASVYHSNQYSKVRRYLENDCDPAGNVTNCLASEIHHYNMLHNYTIIASRTESTLEFVEDFLTSSHLPDIDFAEVNTSALETGAQGDKLLSSLSSIHTTNLSSDVEKVVMTNDGLLTNVSTLAHQSKSMLDSANSLLNDSVRLAAEVEMVREDIDLVRDGANRLHQTLLGNDLALLQNETTSQHDDIHRMEEALDRAAMDGAAVYSVINRTNSTVRETIDILDSIKDMQGE